MSITCRKYDKYQAPTTTQWSYSLANLILGQQSHGSITDTVPTLRARGPTERPIQCASSVTRPRHGTDHTILCSAEVMNKLYVYFLHISSLHAQGQPGHFLQKKKTPDHINFLYVTLLGEYEDSCGQPLYNHHSACSTQR